MGTQPIYMDYNATTPVDPRVLEVMLPYFTEMYGNAASVDHLHGEHARSAVENAREIIAKSIGARRSAEIIFTSGATESDNLALKGVAEANSARGNHIITTATEHHAVLDTVEALASKGFDITVLPVDQFGRVDPDDISKAITSRTLLISVIAANNEVGTLNDLSRIGQIAKEREILFHTDATQAVGHIPIDVEEMGIDLMSFSAHKMYGPKGCGALYVRSRRPRVKLDELIHGGGHEKGLRSGTLNVPGIVGFAAAVGFAMRDMSEEGKRLHRWTEHMHSALASEVEGLERNGHAKVRLPGTLNIFIPQIVNRTLMMELRDVVAISAGSACTSDSVEPSHVLLAMGCDELRSDHSIRLSMGRFTTELDVHTVSEKMVETIFSLRRSFSSVFNSTT
jgi:cysteine desulfurase